MTEQSLALRGDIGIISAQEPKEVVERATKQAEALMDIVEKKALYKQIGAKKHLYVEAWQTIARFNGCLVDVAWSRPLVENGAVVGYEARAELVRLADAMRLVGAEAECRFDEENWDDRDAFAVRSMAQTRAQSKVGRMAYAWVAVLAGYAGTPAEEMTKEYHDREPNEEGPRVPFGRDKGKLVSELTVAKDISWLADAVAKSVADPAKARYKPQNERLYAALTARLADLSAPVAAPTRDKEVPQPSDEPHGADATVQPAAAGAIDPSWHEKLQVEVTAVQTERDPKKLVLNGLLSSLGYKTLADVKSQAEGVKVFAEYLKRTGKPRQEAMPV